MNDCEIELLTITKSKSQFTIKVSKTWKSESNQNCVNCMHKLKPDRSKCRSLRVPMLRMILDTDTNSNKTTYHINRNI